MELCRRAPRRGSGVGRGPGVFGQRPAIQHGQQFSFCAVGPGHQRRGYTLFIADTDHHRVLRFSNAHTRTEGMPQCDPGGIFGQPTELANEPDTAADRMFYPGGLVLSPAGTLWVSDYSNNRVLGFKNATAAAPDRTADVVLGQSDFSGFNSGTAPNRLSAPAALALTANRLWVCDLSNQRVCAWDIMAAASP